MERIDLAHTLPFALGPLAVRPSTREVVDADGVVELVEPRVMQVLVALARADGGVVSRDDLTLSCWEGRVVGDDAINRVISRLRKLADGLGQGRFRVETVTRVGYRLVREDAAGDADTPPAAALPPTPARVSRRAWIAGGAGVSAAALIGGIGWWRAAAPTPLAAVAAPPQVAALMDQARHAALQANPEGLSQALGLYRRVVDLAPDYADGWGALADAYANAAHVRAPEFTAEMERRAHAAAERALALDRDNPLARLALLDLLPKAGKWLQIEQAAIQARRDHPGQVRFTTLLRQVCDSTGRMREAATLIEQEARESEPSPALAYMRVIELWSANRLEEADRAMNEATEVYPTHFAVWFTRFYLLLYSGRAEQALALVQDVENRPAGISLRSFDGIVPVAQAMISRAPADIDRAMAVSLAAAHDGAGFAENAIQFASAFGRLDDAFRVAEGYYFGRGFAVGDQRFSKTEGSYTQLGDRRTRILFFPSCRALRADPRFERLVSELGLARYWAQSHTVPDYRTGKA